MDQRASAIAPTSPPTMARTSKTKSAILIAL